jgi:hypothetical protein
MAMGATPHANSGSPAYQSKNKNRNVIDVTATGKRFGL